MKLYVVRRSKIAKPPGPEVRENVSVWSDIDGAYEDKHVRSRADSVHYYSVEMREVDVDVDVWFPATPSADLPEEPVHSHDGPVFEKATPSPAAMEATPRTDEAFKNASRGNGHFLTFVRQLERELREAENTISVRTDELEGLRLQLEEANRALAAAHPHA